MAPRTRLLVPWATWGALRDQLGSVRGIYVGRDRVQRRDDFHPSPAQPDRAPVVLLHGFFQTRNLWEVMEDRLRYDGYPVMSFNLGGLLWRYNTHPVQRTAAMVAAKVERLAARHGFGRVHVIGHSKGGLIARAWVQRHGGDRRVASVITLGTPHHGTPTAALAVGLMGFGAWPSSARDLLPRSAMIRDLGRDRFPAHVPMTSIYSTSDLVCPAACSVLRPRDGARLRNVAVHGVGHSELAWNAGVYRQVRGALADAAPASEVAHG